RGHNTIAIFAIDPATGKLTPAGHQGQHVKTPRNFAIDPTGAYLLVGNQDANSIVVFRIDPATGALAPAGEPVAVPKPAGMEFLPAGGSPWGRVAGLIPAAPPSFTAPQGGTAHGLGVCPRRVPESRQPLAPAPGQAQTRRPATRIATLAPPAAAPPVGPAA